MTREGCCGILTAMCWVAMAGAAVAGPYDVTFQVPLNLTRIPTDITSVRVFCLIRSDALPVDASGTDRSAGNYSGQLAVTGGQVVTTVTVVVPITTLDTSSGKTSATYSCFLEAALGSDVPKRFTVNLSTATPGSAYYLSPPPQAQGTFTW